MKKVTLILAVTVATLSLHAQNQTYTQMFDSLFSNVPYNTATTGILHDRVANFSGIGLFNLQTTDTSDYTRFVQAYSELHRAVINPAINQQFSLETDSLREMLKNISYIPIGIINAQYDIVDTNAFHSGKLYESNGLFYVNNAIGGSLFTQKQAILALPLVEQVGSSVQFGLSNMFIFENSTSAVSSVSIDFDDGNGLNNYAVGNTNIVVSYIIDGLKSITIQVHLSNGNTVISYSSLEVVIPIMQAIHKSIDGAAEDEGKVDARIPYLSVAGHAILKYYYQTPNQLQKPVVIVTGFDPEDNDKFDDAIKRMDYGSENLGQDLFDLGYDIVVVDFPDYTVGGWQDIRGGGDYIQRNAFTVIEIINRLNRELAASGSPHELVIIAPSMGGQITRYALAYMEQNPGPLTNYGKHNCRLWISFDSPHQGANMSYGAQGLLHHFWRELGFGAAETYYKAYLEAPAAKQMLIHNLLDKNKTAYTAYYDEIKSLGYPTDLRKIAVSNGSLNNTSNDGVAGELAFNGTVWWSLGAFTIDVRIRNIADAGLVDACNVVWWFLFVPITNKYPFDNNTGKCSPDVAPGSYYNTFDKIRESLKKFGATIRINQHTHCFMPVTSVLDISGDMNYCTDVSGMDLVALGRTPFQSYCSPGNDTNMEHVTYDATIANYVRNEIETYIEPGDREVSLCNIATYSVHFPAGKTSAVTWTCSPNLEIVSGQGTKTVTVRAIGTGNNEWVCATPSGVLTHNRQLKKYAIKVISNQPNVNATAPAEINGNVTWNTNRMLCGNMSIKSGATLTLIATAFALGHTITIENGGKLILSGGTIDDGKVIVQNGGELTIINNGKILLENYDNLEVQDGGIFNFDLGEILLK